MKITELEILKVPPSWVWLRIHTDTELVGLGEPYLENHPDTVVTEVRRLEPILIGKDPTRVEALWQEMYRSGLSGESLACDLGSTRVLAGCVDSIPNHQAVDRSSRATRGIIPVYCSRSGSCSEHQSPRRGDVFGAHG